MSLTAEECFAKLKEYGITFGYNEERFNYGVQLGRNYIKVFHPFTNLSDIPHYYDGGELSFTKGGVKFYFQLDQSSTSCAIPVFGYFSGMGGKTFLPEELALLLRLACLRHEKEGYVQAVTLSKREWGRLNKAFEIAGFEERARVKSRHGKYFNIVWEWKATPSSK